MFIRGGTFLAHGYTMSEQRRDSIPLRPTLLRVAFLLALIIVVHQAVMATPAHEAIMPMAGHDMQASAPMQESRSCPCCPVQSAAICPAVQAALPAGTETGFLLLLLAALVATAFIVRITGPGVVVTADWRPPPGQMLALFQTFRC